MDSQNLKQRTAAESANSAAVEETTAGDDKIKTSKRSSKRGRARAALAKRGLRSLAVAVSVSVALTLLAVYFGSSDSYKNTTVSKPPFWFPPLWALHFTSTASAFLMGLSAWLIWTEGGFHNSPTALYLYLAQLVLGLVWDPIVFGAGLSVAGLVICMGMLGALIGCYQAFKEVNPIASEVIKPCLAWAAFLVLVNLTLVCL
ncbi:Translocator-like protein [Morus notabilis]|uniref:Translocator-like protein n=1 Tax=Morus notabilis TaxID=981085 RepID=W9QWS6_9ROSA|nr:translocator protein homolog [Morus notabilis]EXB40845.1 Translocator-like protein [Morus notabilis]